jgi:putative membrane protein
MMGGFGIGALIMLVFWALVIGGVVWFAAALARGGAGTGITLGAKQNPLDILKTRYAKGEITKEQFEEVKRNIS